MELLDSNSKKNQVRTLQVERRRFEMELAHFDAAKRFISVDMRKTQTEMKRRLKRYKERQKEIASTRSPDENKLYGQFMNRPVTTSTCKSRLISRPCTSYVQSKGKCLDGDQNEGETDKAFVTDRARSKIDLRPSSAWSFQNRPVVDTQALEFRRNGGSLRTLRLGTPAAQIRYFDDDELRDRSTLYSQILQQRKKKEKEHYEELALKVLDFCDVRKKKAPANKVVKCYMRFGCVMSVEKSVVLDGRVKRTNTSEYPNIIKAVVFNPNPLICT